jgi:2-polyprenyl-3-methyl-5-hydroxy-6-metoxy-1,4-benzoquinol methylase
MKKSDRVKCIFCGEKANFFLVKADRVSGKPYDIYKCTACKSGFVFPIPNEVELSNFYKHANTPRELYLRSLSALDAMDEILRGEEDFPNSTVDAIRLSKTGSKFTELGEALDVGAGYGFTSRELKKLGYDVTALEVGEASRKVFNELCGFNALPTFFNEEFCSKNSSKFDLVILSQVIEHLSFDKNPLKNINTVLKDEGVVVLAFPNFSSLLAMLLRKRDFFLIPPEHLNYFAKTSICELLLKEGFEILKVETVSRFNPESLNKFGIFKPVISTVLRAFLKFSDSIGRGMFLNIYARKVGIEGD